MLFIELFFLCAVHVYTLFIIWCYTYVSNYNIQMVNNDQFLDTIVFSINFSPTDFNSSPSNHFTASFHSVHLDNVHHQVSCLFQYCSLQCLYFLSLRSLTFNFSPYEILSGLLSVFILVNSSILFMILLYTLYFWHLVTCHSIHPIAIYHYNTILSFLLI